MIQQNITNLTSLWRIAGERANGYQPGPAFDICAITNSEWPNKLWFHNDPDREQVKTAMEQLWATSTKLSVLYWDIYHSRSYELLEAAGLKKTSEQVGMVLALKQPPKPLHTIRLEPVTTLPMALDWEALFCRAFGYRIPARLLLPAYPTTHFLLAYHENTAVGTCALHYTDNQLVGIHSVGIIPEMRGNGLAYELMITLLNRATAQGFSHATLQASDMGKGLYLKLGFVEQFIQMNYSLPSV